LGGRQGILYRKAITRLPPFRKAGFKGRAGPGEKIRRIDTGPEDTRKDHRNT